MHEIKTEKYRGFVPLRIALFVLAGAALVTLVFWQMRISDKRAELAALQTQIEMQNTKNAEIQKTVSSLENDNGLKEYAERKAREDLDYAKPEERIFVDVGGGD
ncbi:septum formation initiator family protein [uncultured Neglectibacter sp.]|uniref:FtsB family cell division protein n=1 Tax=uncultured Neglectibacter sp. TaxID=1924108 RepID=UPI0034DDEC09